MGAVAVLTIPDVSNAGLDINCWNLFFVVLESVMLALLESNTCVDARLSA